MSHGSTRVFQIGEATVCALRQESQTQRHCSSCVFCKWTEVVMDKRWIYTHQQTRIRWNRQTPCYECANIIISGLVWSWDPQWECETVVEKMDICRANCAWDWPWGNLRPPQHWGNSEGEIGRIWSCVRVCVLAGRMLWGCCWPTFSAEQSSLS